VLDACLNLHTSRKSIVARIRVMVRMQGLNLQYSCEATGTHKGEGDCNQTHSSIPMPFPIAPSKSSEVRIRAAVSPSPLQMPCAVLPDSSNATVRLLAAAALHRGHNDSAMSKLRLIVMIVRCKHVPAFYRSIWAPFG
jgi:hypothetical protein